MTYRALVLGLAACLSSLLACASDAAGEGGASTFTPAPESAAPEAPVSPAERARVLPGFTSACGALAGGLVAHVQPDVPFDYLASRREKRGKDGWTVETLQQVGTLCATARDAATCTARADAVRKLTDASCALEVSECSAMYYVFTRGDDVLVAYEPEEIRALVGRVDNPSEAYEIARLAGRLAYCSESTVMPQWAPVPGGGFDLVVESSECTSTEAKDSPRRVYRTVVRVAPDQTITEISRELLGVDAINGCHVADLSL